jgi:hypothetical protein
VEVGRQGTSVVVGGEGSARSKAHRAEGAPPPSSSNQHGAVRGNFGEGGFAAVAIGVKPKETTEVRVLALAFSRDVYTTAEWCRRGVIPGQTAADKEVRIIRVGSVSPVMTMLEACGNVGLMQRFWSVIACPQAHCSRVDVTRAIRDLNDAVNAASTAITSSSSTSKAAAYNASQVKAIHASVAPMTNPALSHVADLLPFSLIQGPPGTGKTHTIVGLILRWLAEHSQLIDPGKPHLGRRCVQRILVCTASNIAVDEVALRLQRHGIRLPDGTLWRPVFVRIGIRDSVDVELLNTGIFIDDCVKRLMDARATTGSTSLAHQMKAVREEVLEAADIVFTTFGSMKNMPSIFPLVIADEAAMTTEPMLYTALQYGCKRCVLVGDPQQLEATLRSRTAYYHGFSQSLMQRLVLAGYPCVMLNTQFRMHPDIVEFPSRYFYHGELQTASDLLVTPTPPSQTQSDEPAAVSGPPRRSTLLGGIGMPADAMRFVFFDVGGHEGRRGNSIVNVLEADIVMALVLGLKQVLPSEAMNHVGVITFYSAQTRLLRERARAVNAIARGATAESFVNTVDGFQGRERGGIILSCVRSAGTDDGREGGAGKSHRREIGFLSDPHRVNVALTRAQAFCYVVGDSRALETQEGVWRQLIKHAVDTRRFIPRECVETAWNTALREAATNPGEHPWLPMPRTSA